MSASDIDWSGICLKKELEAKDPQRTNIVMLREDTQEIKENVSMWDQRTLFLTVSKKKKKKSPFECKTNKPAPRADFNL